MCQLLLARAEAAAWRCAVRHRDNRGRTALFEAAARSKEIATLLIITGADVNAAVWHLVGHFLGILRYGTWLGIFWVSCGMAPGWAF
jgi:hypothetical protein